MIRIEIEEVTAAETIATLMALAAGFATGGPVHTSEEQPVEEPKPTRRAAAAKPKAEEPGKSAPTAEGKTGSNEPAKSTSASTAEPTASDLPEGVDATDKGSVKGFVSSAADVIGLDQLAQVFGEFGATKFGEVAAEQWPALIIRLDDLVTAKQQEA